MIRLCLLHSLLVLAAASPLQAQSYFDPYGHGWEFGTPVPHGERDERSELRRADTQRSSGQSTQDVAGLTDDNPPQNIVNCWMTTSGPLVNDVVVEVRFVVGSDRRVVPGSLRLVSAIGGDEEDQRMAFEAARRAILRCELQGYTVPDLDENGEREVIITFDPRTNRAD